MAKRIKWTTEQARAIAEHSRDVYVTASAGTGKTAVLSGRVVAIAADKNICPDVWSLLVLTFTDMAAEEMRSRIAAQLREKMLAANDRDERGHLRRQLLLLGGADISTIHSFCKRIITEHFYQLGLDPTFAMLDADEANLLKAHALEKTIDWAWRQDNLSNALKQLLNRRNLRINDGFLSQIIHIHNYLDGVVCRDDWYTRAEKLAGELNPFASDIADEQKKLIAVELRGCIDRVRYAQRLCGDNGGDTAWIQWWQDNFVDPIDLALKAIERNDWQKFTERLKEFEWPKRFNMTAKGLDGPILDIAKNNVTKARDRFKTLSQEAVAAPVYLDRLAGVVNIQTMLMLKLVKKFQQFYRRAKQAVNCLDFADLEHHALKLLSTGFEDDKPIPSAVAKLAQKRFRYIFIDEYQDINAVQQAIIDCLSQGGNVFGVGDAKQSIYAWRGAQPDIFLSRVNSATIEPSGNKEGLRVDLNVNFRSDAGVLEFVNRIFARVMTAGFGNIDYDESAYLKPGREENTGSNKNEPVVELHVLDEQIADAGGDDDNPQSEQQNDESARGTFTGRQRQAALIAQRIKQMVGAETGKTKLQVLDKTTGQRRSIEYRDIVILMRSVSKKVDFIEVLRLAGIPVVCEATAGYFEATEIADMLSLLKVLDNPRRDIELAAVMRSPFFGFTDTELAKIRLAGRSSESKLSFFDCVTGYSEQSDKLAEKVKKNLQQIEKWRTVARLGKLAELLWRVYRKTGFLSFVSALPSGAGRRANLLRLHERAIQFEGFASSGPVPSLTRFIEFVEKLIELGQDWSAAEPETGLGNTVAVLSVHKSKGLEFPVVFLADINSTFNMVDTRQDCLVDEKLGLGLKIIDNDTDGKFSSSAYQVIAEKRKEVSRAEEMRILYVAMTRARDRLILVGSQKQKRCREILCTGLLAAERIADWQLRACNNHLDWILLGLGDSAALHRAFEIELKPKTDTDKLFTAKLSSNDELDRLNEYIEQIRKNKTKKKRPRKSNKKDRPNKLLETIKQRLQWRYDFADVCELPAKRSVSQWTHRDDEFAQHDYSTALDRIPAGLIEHPGEHSELGRLVGTATHLVISQLDLTATDTAAAQSVLDQIVENKSIVKSVATRVNIDAIAGFFKTDLGKSALAEPDKVHREWSFTFAVPAKQWAQPTETATDETIIVQGIIDMLIETEQGLVIIDFKTDHLTPADVPKRAESYRQQLQLYARAASTILNKPLTSAWLHFLNPAIAVEI